MEQVGSEGQGGEGRPLEGASGSQKPGLGWAPQLRRGFLSCEMGSGVRVRGGL